MSAFFFHKIEYKWNYHDVSQKFIIFPLWTSYTSKKKNEIKNP